MNTSSNSNPKSREAKEEPVFVVFEMNNDMGTVEMDESTDMIDVEDHRLNKILYEIELINDLSQALLLTEKDMADKKGKADAAEKAKKYWMSTIRITHPYKLRNEKYVPRCRKGFIRLKELFEKFMENLYQKKISLGLVTMEWSYDEAERIKRETIQKVEHDKKVRNLEFKNQKDLFSIIISKEDYQDYISVKNREKDEDLGYLEKVFIGLD